MRVTAIILLALLSIDSAKNEEAAPSDLQLLANDIKILSRMTNAIAIEELVSKGSANVSDIISEFLHVPYHLFESYVDVDNLKIRDVLNFANKSMNVSKKTDDDDTFKSNLKSFFDKIKVLLKDDSNVLEKAGKFQTENIFNEGKNITNSKIVNNDCLKLDQVNLEEFRKLIDVKEDWHKLPEDHKIAYVIYGFIPQSTHLLNCLNNVANLTQYISSSTIWKAKAEYKNVETMRQIAAKFFEFNLNKATFKKLKKHIVDMLTSYKEVMDGYSSLTEAVMIFRQAINNTSPFSKIESLTPRYTIGFEGIEGIANLTRDLKNPWFNKHFVRNSNSKEFGKSLNSLIKFSKNIQNIVNIWQGFFHASRKFFNHKERNVFDDYLAIVEKAYHSRDALTQLINYWKSLDEDCAQLNYSNEALKKLADYERQQHDLLVIIRRITKLRSYVEKLNNQLHYVSEKEGTLLNIFKKQLSSVLNVTRSVDNPLIDRYALQHFIQRLKGSFIFIRTLKIATKLADSLQTLKMESARLKMNDTIKLNDILETMNVTTFIKCIRDERLNISLVVDWYRAHWEMKKIYRSGGLKVVKLYVDTLALFPEMKDALNSYMRQFMNKNKWNQRTKNLEVKIENPLKLTENLVAGTRFLEDMEKVRFHRNILLNIGELTRFEQNALKEFNLDEWLNMTELLKAMVHNADELNSLARKLRNASISNVTQIFSKASKIPGIPGTRENLELFLKKIRRISPDSVSEEKFLLLFFTMGVDFDFAARRSNLENFPNSVKQLMDYFDGRKNDRKHSTKPPSIWREIILEQIWREISWVCLGVIALISLGLLSHGLTESGRKNYQNLYLYYFVNWKVFEERWRYSLFMDTINRKNAILDAVRERNKTNLLKALKSGAYINVYNKYGNTALHVATKTGLPDFVDILIKYGADRSLLNASNLTPQEMIPPNFHKTHSKDAAKFEKIQAIYKKNEKKTFRIAVPQVFPVSSFHIWMDDTTDDSLTNAFMDKFPHITSGEAMHTTTHVIFPTDAEGIVQIDRLEQVIWICHGAIIVKEQWMVDCLNDPKLIEHDSKYLVEKVRFDGVIYDTVLEWTEAMAKSTMPYLCGAYVAAVMKECPYLTALSEIVTNQGGVMMRSFPVKEDFNIGSHPYLHANLGPIFLINDGTIDLVEYENDPDEMYTVFTKNEFIIFLLKRQINQDTRKNPPPVSKDDI